MTMTQSLLANLPAVTGAFALLAALALCFSGLALIAYGARASREALARRIRLIQPFGRNAPPTVTEKGSNESLVRATSSRAAKRDGQMILRMCAGFGIAPEYAMAAFLAARASIAILFGGTVIFFLPSSGALAAFSVRLLIAAGVAIVGSFVPSFFVRRRMKEHQKSVVSGLPDALELLVICVEAGLSLEDSLNRIVKELKLSHPELAIELALTSADLKILPSRDQAFANLAARVDAPSIRSVVTTLSQTMRYGTPLAQAMRVVAAEMRNDSLIAMEDRANRLPALLTVPMMLFIMPTIFLIVGGPAALRVMDTLLK
jgi:tight adherence protein C